MKAFIGLAIAFGLAVAVSGQRQPAFNQGVKPLDVPLPALEPGQKPNFIVIVTDDQGWDDLGRNNPKFVSTPNMDRFIQEGTFFDNFYVTPQCAQSRAAMLTGRYPARVGTMLVNGAWDFINSHEVTGGKLMASQNYATAQFGKWHNSEVQGYEPWSPMVGFQKADIPVSNDGTSNMRLMRTNGSYEAAEGDIERVLASKMIGYLDSRDAESKPFYIYYALHSIHMLYEKINGKRQTNQIRFAPAKYKAKYHSDARLKALGVTNATIDAWAALEYMDDVLGSVFEYLKTSGLDKTTYVMLMSDNGAAIVRDERASVDKRMPSGMKGDKSTIWEGGIRNFMAVQGPGVQAGVVDSTLLHIIDILPTVTDLAKVRKDAAGHLPFDGLSFKNLLLNGNSEPAPAAKKRRAATEAAEALGEGDAMYAAGHTPTVTAMTASEPATTAAAVTTMSKAPAAAAPATKAPVAGNAAASKAPVAAAPATGNAEPSKTPAAAAPVTKAPATPTTGMPAADSKAPVTAAPVAAPASTPAASGNQTASNAPVAAAPVAGVPAAAFTGNSSSTQAAPVADSAAPATVAEPATTAPVATPAPAADSTAPAAVPANSTAAAPAAEPATPAAAAPATKAPAPASKAPVAVAPAPAAPKVPAPAPAATAPAPATKVPTPAPAATKAPAQAAAGSKTPAPAKKHSTKAAVPPAAGKAPAPSTGKAAVKAPSAAAGKATPAAPATGKTPAAHKPATGDKPSKPRAAPRHTDDASEEPAAPAPVAPAPRRIVGRGGRAPVVARGDRLATWQQSNRMLFFMAPHCWDANAVPQLGPNREVLRPQPLFNYKTGGMLNVINGRELPADKKKLHPGFEICMAVRHREFKWMGLTDMVYRVNGTHLEQPSTEVPEPQATALRTMMKGAAEKWWQSVVMEPHSLEKPMFYLGLEKGVVTNMLVSGAHERTAEHIRLIPNGAAGFKVAGDRICFTVKVMSPGTYDVIAFYASAATATMKLSIGTYGQIQTGVAKSIIATLPAQGRMKGLNMGALVNVTATGAKPTEACLQLVSSSTPGKAVFSILSNLRFTKREPWQRALPAPREPNQPVSHHGFGASIDSVPAATGSSQNGADNAAPVAVPAPGLDMSSPSNSWLQGVAAPTAGFGKVTDKWEALRIRNAWPDGQGTVFESMYSPYNTEDIEECSICKPEV